MLGSLRLLVVITFLLSAVLLPVAILHAVPALCDTGFLHQLPLVLLGVQYSLATLLANAEFSDACDYVL